MFLAGRLGIPAGTRAVLFDLDGVLVDSLSLDYDIVAKLLGEEIGRQIDVPHALIRENFAYSVPDFWRRIGCGLGLALSEESIDRLVESHDLNRRVAKMPLHEGIPDLLAAARACGLSIGVVSNNAREEILRALENSGISADVVVGCDGEGMLRKPAPDTYIAAVKELELEPAMCVAVEDSLLGAEAASDAGCLTLGVSTGGTTFDLLQSSKYIDVCYTDFAPCELVLGRDGVTNKSLTTPNDFVSHMVEHIAWRLGCSIRLVWTNNDWRELGRELGREIRKFPVLRPSARTIGMIDDGSAEVSIRESGAGSATLSSSSQVDLPWFLSSRAEQLNNGLPLVELLEGLAESADLQIEILVSAFEDPHHTWEGIFRGVGIALDKMINALTPEPARSADAAVATDSTPATGAPAEHAVEQGWRVGAASPRHARLERCTAESVVAVDLELNDSPHCECSMNVADSIHVLGMSDLLTEFAEAAGIRLKVTFDATLLSSSHVVAEDIGMVIGRALRLIAVERMESYGIHGAGSSLSAADSERQPVRVGVSMEGRKFWKYVPMSQSYPDFRKSFLIGHTLPNGLFSEDLDDFIDGLTGGMLCSVIVHVDGDVLPAEGWPLIFRGLGTALAGFFEINPYRRALAPGVKATLA